MLRHKTDITRNTAVYELGFNNFYGPDVTGKFIFPDGETPPTEEAIQTKLVELQAEYDAQEYARNRQVEYPSISDLVVALYDTDDKSAIEAKRASVKAKYPKP